MPRNIYDPEPDDIYFSPAPWNPFHQWKFNEQEMCGASCLQVSEAFGPPPRPSLCSSRSDVGSPFVFKSHCWGHMAARTLVVESMKCYRASNNALCFPFICDPGLSGGPGIPQPFGGTSLGRSMKEIFLFPSLTLSSLSSSQLMVSAVQNTAPCPWRCSPVH